MVIEKDDESAHGADTTSSTSAELAEALDAVKSSAPSLAQQLGAADLTPDKLAEAHQRATSEEHGSGRE